MGMLVVHGRGQSQLRRLGQMVGGGPWGGLQPPNYFGHLLVADLKDFGVLMRKTHLRKRQRMSVALWPWLVVRERPRVEAAVGWRVS